MGYCLNNWVITAATNYLSFIYFLAAILKFEDKLRLCFILYNLYNLVLLLLKFSTNRNNIVYTSIYLH